MKIYLDKEEAEILQDRRNQKLVVSKERNKDITKAVKSAKKHLKEMSN